MRRQSQVLPRMGPGQTQAQPPEQASRKSPARAAKEAFRLSPFRIRFKLLMITSLVILAALGGMILIATNLFREEVITRAQEGNLKLTRTIGTNVQLAVLNQIHHSGSLLRGGNPVSDAWSRHVVFAGVPRAASPEAKTLSFARSWQNRAFLVENGLSPTIVAERASRYADLYRAALGGNLAIENVSPDFGIPMLAVAAPLTRSETMLILLDPAGILSQFSSEGIVRTFMVNERGDVLAHHDTRFVLAKTNLSTSPIVRAMLESRFDNGQQRSTDATGRAQLASFQKLADLSAGIIAQVEEDRAFAAVDNIQRQNLYLTIAFVCAAMLVVVLFSRRLTHPILRLVGAAENVRQGKYDVSLKAASHDELGLLTHAFNDMASGLAEREQLREAFGKFVDYVVAEHAVSGRMNLGGERRDCAILFADLRGFTRLSAAMSSEETVALLNEYFSAMVARIHQTGGIVDKFIGDAIMAHWGAVRSGPNDTESAVNAALGMRSALVAYNQNRTGLRRLQFGIGISSGSVIAGQIGSLDRLEFTVLGDPVNLASRIEGLNKRFGTDILISREACQKVARSFHLRKIPDVSIRGLRETKEVFAVLGRRDDPHCPRDIHELRRRIGIHLPAGGEDP